MTNKMPPELLEKFKKKQGGDDEKKEEGGNQEKRKSALEKARKAKEMRKKDKWLWMSSTSEIRSRFEEILEAARTQDRSNQSATMVVLSHIQQMVLYMIKKGITF